MDSVINTKDIIFDDDEKKGSVVPSKVEQPALSTSNVLFEKEPSFLSGIGETAEDVLTSAAQEASFGFSDEAIAYAKALLEKKKADGPDFWSTYEKYRDIERERVRQAKERSPVLSTIGALSGAAVPLVFSGGLSGVATAGTRLLPAAARLVGTGAAQGAVSAIGKSEKELGEETAKEALTGAAEGAALAGGMGAAGAALGAGASWVGKKIKESPLAQQVILSRNLAKEGVDLTDRMFFTSSKRSSEELAKDVQGALSGIGTDISESLISAEKQGIKITGNKEDFSTVESAIKSLKESNVFGSKTQSFIDDLESLFSKTDPATGISLSSGLSPVKANEIRKKIRDEIFDAVESGKINRTQLDDLNQLNVVLKNKLNLIPDFKKSNDFYEEFARKVPGAAGGKGFEEVVEIKNPVTGETQKIKTGTKTASEMDFRTIETNLESLINKIYAGGATKKDQVAAFEMLKRNLKELQQTKPELLKRYGIDPDQIISTIEKEANIAEIGRGLHGTEPQESIFKKTFNIASPSGLLYRGAGLLGEAQQLASKVAKTGVVKTPVELSKTLYSLPLKATTSLAEKMVRSPSKKLSTIGSEMLKAAESGNVETMKRVKFLLITDPELRDQIVPYLGEE